MVRVISKLSVSGALGFLGLSFGACSQNTPEANEPHVGPLESALESPVESCEQQQVSCLRAATDRAEAVECSAAFRECLGGAADAGQQLAAALQACRDKATECAVQGGAMGASTCRDELEACVSAASAEDSQPPAADAGTPDPMQPSAAGEEAPAPPDAGGPGIPGRPGLPGGRLPFAGAGGLGGLPTLPGQPRLPSAGGGAFPRPGGRGLPGSGQSACFEALRMCIEAPSADLNQCATDARACVRGGGPLGAAGTGGAPPSP